MATDVPHLRAILLFGFAAATAGVVGLTWVYPAYRAKVFDVKEAKQRQLVEATYGIPAGSCGLVRSGRVPGRELCHGVGTDAPAGRAGVDAGGHSPKSNCSGYRLPRAVPHKAVFVAKSQRPPL